MNKEEILKVINSNKTDEQKIEELQNIGLELEEIFTFILENF